MMKNSVNFFFTVLIGMTVILSVSGFPHGLFNQMKTAPVFGVAIVVLFAGGLFPMVEKRALRHVWEEVIYFCFLFFYLMDFAHFGNLWNLGCLCLLLLFVLLCWVKKVKYTVLMVCCVCSVVWLAAWGYLQYWEYVPLGNRYFILTGPFHNPAILAIMVALLLGVLINVMIRFYASLRKYPLVLAGMAGAVIFCTPVLVLSAARAAYVALLVSVVYGLCFNYMVRTSWKRRLLYLLGLFLVVLLTSGALYAIKPQSAKGRILIWKVSCRMIQDKPLWGFGKGGFAANYLYYQAEYMKSSATQEEKWLAGSTHLAFNEPLRVAVEHGLIGLLIYVVFTVWILFLLPVRKGICAISRSLLAGIVAWGLFAYPDQTFSVLLLWVIGVASSVNHGRAQGGAVAEKEKLCLGMVSVVVCSLAVIVGVMLHSKWESYHGLQIGLKSRKVRDISGYAAVMDGFVEKMNDDPSFVYFCCQVARASKCDSGFLYSLRFLEKNLPTPGVWMMKGDYWKEKGRWAEAETAYRLAADMVPSRQMSRGRLALLYNEIGRRHEALAIAREILTEKVKVYGFDTFILHRDLKRIFEDELK